MPYAYPMSRRGCSPSYALSQSWRTGVVVASCAPLPFFVERHPDLLVLIASFFCIDSLQYTIPDKVRIFVQGNAPIDIKILIIEICSFFSYYQHLFPIAVWSVVTRFPASGCFKCHYSDLVVCWIPLYYGIFASLLPNHQIWLFFLWV